MHRRFLLVALLSSTLLAALQPVSVAAADPPPLPNIMAAVGDSVTQATSSGGSLGTDYPANSWSTGTNTSVNSHYLRLLALNPTISGNNVNRSVSGAKMSALNGQMLQVVPLQPGYVTVLMGGNDICTNTVDQMTPVSTFRAQFTAAMDTLTASSPGTYVYVLSIPRVTRLWELFKDDFFARFIWSVGGICQSLLANPTSTQAVDVARRAAVAQRNVDFNTQLAEVCAAYVRCRFDNNAVYNTNFVTSDVAGDYFHPSVTGLAKLAAGTWDVGYWAAGAPLPNQAPLASFTYACSDLSCTFNGSASSDSDGSVVAFDWQFGDGALASGATTGHTFGAGGTYTVSLTVHDDDGATAATGQSVTVSAPSAVQFGIESLSGLGSPRRGGWTATVTVTLMDSNGRPVNGAVVSGTWSTGATGTCTTDASSSCSFSVNVGKKTASVTWSVLTIVHATLTYDPAMNAESFEIVVRP